MLSLLTDHIRSSSWGSELGTRRCVVQTSVQWVRVQSCGSAPLAVSSGGWWWWCLARGWCAWMWWRGSRRPPRPARPRPRWTPTTCTARPTGSSTPRTPTMYPRRRCAPSRRISALCTVTMVCTNTSTLYYSKRFCTILINTHWLKPAVFTDARYWRLKGKTL